MTFLRHEHGHACMMTSSNRNIFRVTGYLRREFTGHKGQQRGALMFSFICAWINGWVNNREAGDLRCHHNHYDVTVMMNMDMLITSLIVSSNRFCEKHLHSQRIFAGSFFVGTNKIFFTYWTFVVVYDTVCQTYFTVCEMVESKITMLFRNLFQHCDTSINCKSIVIT